MERIVIVGSSGHAHLVIEAVEKENRYKIAGLLDSFKMPGPTALGYDIIGKVEDLPELMQRYEVQGGIVGVGDNWTRAGLVQRIDEICPYFKHVGAVHPSCSIARKSVLGRGVVLMAGAVVNPNSELRDFSFLSTGASLDHDSVMGRYSSLAPGVTTGGNVRIGEFSAVCLGANVIHGITIGAHTVVGAGATVLDDLPDHVVAYGVPARVIRKREAGEKYF